VYKVKTTVELTLAEFVADPFVRTDEKDASFDGMHHEDAGAQETKESADIAHKEVMLRV